ncbi:DUF6042 family protein [Streptomyces sp. NPDC004232]|uniref:DUF6042 family protein n=1 Tax=Streptomyces sp. NPDC004232 TaxID=3154454 RepID=UPI0033A26C53
MIGGDLGGVLTFSWPDEEWDYEEAPEGREAHEAHRWEKFGVMLTAAGYPVPKTVRDLSELYLTWGLAHCEETPDGPRWSMPAARPGVEQGEAAVRRERPGVPGCAVAPALAGRAEQGAAAGAARHGAAMASRPRRTPPHGPFPEKAPGRPQTVHSIRALALHLVREIPGWGYRRVRGELLVLGIKVAGTTPKTDTSMIVRAPSGLEHRIRRRAAWRGSERIRCPDS